MRKGRDEVSRMISLTLDEWGSVYGVLAVFSPDAKKIANRIRRQYRSQMKIERRPGGGT